MSTSWGSGDPEKYLPPDIADIIFNDHHYYAYGDNAPATKQEALGIACISERGGNDAIVGEWSLSVREGVADPDHEKDWDTSFWWAQVHSYEQAAGWVFWTWKCNWINGRDEWRWCYERAVANGVIPQNANGPPPVQGPCL